MKFNVEKLLRLAVVIAAIVAIAAIAVITIGTLAIPVIMSLAFSWYWMFLYVGYLVVILFVAMFACGTDGGKDK